MSKRSGWRNHRESVAVTALDTDIYQFDHWLGEPASNSSNKKQLLSLTGPRHLIAVFGLKSDLAQTTHPVTLHKGWNLISLPVYAEYDDIQQEVLNRISGRPWRWTSGAFAIDENPTTRTGYWLYCTETCTFDLPGVDDDVRTVDLSPGWNLVGSAVTGTLPESDAVDGQIWFWDGSRQRFGTLENGRELDRGIGYWIHAHEEVTLELSE